MWSCCVTLIMLELVCLCLSYVKESGDDTVEIFLNLYDDREYRRVFLLFHLLVGLF